MKPNNTTIKTLLFLLVLIPNILFAGYTASPSSHTSWDSTIYMYPQNKDGIYTCAYLKPNSGRFTVDGKVEVYLDGSKVLLSTSLSNGTKSFIRYKKGDSATFACFKQGTKSRINIKLRDKVNFKSKYHEWTLEKEDTPPPSKPSKPSKPTLTVHGKDKMEIRWNQVSGATHYKLYRATGSNNNYIHLGMVTNRIYYDKNLKDNTTYYYKVKAGNSKGWSGYSSYAKVTTESDIVTPPSPTTSLSKTLGVRYEQPICHETAPTVELKQLTGESSITYNGVKSLSIEFEARVSGGSPSCIDSRNVFHRQHIFTAWKTDKGGFIDKTPSGSSYKYKRVQLIVPISQKDEYRVLLYVGDDLGKEIRKSYIKSKGKDTDGDGTVDKYDFDDDNDGLTDYQESKYSFLNPLIADAKSDYDKDGISNIDEINKYRTNPAEKDTDGDGVNDKEDKYPNDPTKSDDDKKVGNKWIGLKSKQTFSIKEEEVESKTVANFVIVSYKPRPTTPQAFTIYMQDAKGIKSVIQNGQVTLDQERWIEVKLPVGTKAGVYKVWGTVEVNSKESNIKDNTSKIATITVIGEDIKPKPLRFLSVPLYTTKSKILFHILGYESGRLVVNGKKTNIKVGTFIKKVKIASDKEVYNLQINVNDKLSDAVSFQVYKTLDIDLTDQELSVKSKYGSNAGKYILYYRIDIDKKKKLIIDMEAEFDTYLSVTDMKLKRLYQDDNGGSGTNSKLEDIVLNKGSYYIEATTVQKGIKGLFNLSILEEPIDTNTGLTNEVQLSLGSEFIVYRDGEIGDKLTWVIEKNGKIVLERNAKNELQYRYFGNNYSYGSRFRVWVEKFVDGKYQRVSNIVEYEVR